MSLIDWSDPEEMLGLLVEYVADETNEPANDRVRATFLRQLSEELTELASELPPDGAAIARALLAIRNSQPRELFSDPVIVHLDQCIEELDRIARDERHGERR
jgi:hypothetical protein